MSKECFNFCKILHERILDSIGDFWTIREYNLLSSSKFYFARVERFIRYHLLQNR